MDVPGLRVERLCVYLEKLIHVPIMRIDRNGQLLDKFAEGLRDERQEISGENISCAIREGIKIIRRDDESVYGAVADREETVYLIGPVRITDEYVSDQKGQAYDCPFATLLETLMMLREYLTGAETDLIHFLQNEENEEYKRLIEEQRTRYHFSQQENGWIHNSYAQEQREQSAIREGDLEKLNSAFSEPMIGKMGVSSRNRLRSAKNNSLTVIGLSIRSAIEGGLDPEEAFRLSDDYMRRVEAQKDLKKLIEVTRSAEIELTRLVRRKKRSRQESVSPYVDQTKRYIYRHLHGKISVAEIAEEVGVTGSYLSGLFRREEGITITDYIMNLKVYYAQNLLTYSEYSYDEIAYYFGFSSRSHFGAIFKKVTGLTPKQYRDKHRSRKFFREDEEKMQNS